MTTTADTILAIDLGRFKSVPCVYSRSSRNHATQLVGPRPPDPAPASGPPPPAAR